MGPIAPFGKSFIEMLSLDEATMFDSLYSSVICPIFYAEVLADLSKEPPGQRTVEKIVADVARKTPILHSTPNVMHSTLCTKSCSGTQSRCVVSQQLLVVDRSDKTMARLGWCTNKVPRQRHSIAGNVNNSTSLNENMRLAGASN